MKIFIRCIVTILLFCRTLPLSAGEQDRLIVATAANFSRPMEQISKNFMEEQSLKVEAIFSSTGKIYAQIKNGAPYDLFLAADTRRPELLFQDGLCGEPFVYAKGQAVLWSARKDLASVFTWQEVLRRIDVKRIGISNPRTAPYGEMALKALQDAGIFQLVEDRLVYAQNVAQAFQYSQSGGVDFTFTALSYALSEEGLKGAQWTIPEAPSIIQAACVLKNSDNKTEVDSFVAFLKSDKVRNLIAEYGYQ